MQPGAVQAIEGHRPGSGKSVAKMVETERRVQWVCRTVVWPQEQGLRVCPGGGSGLKGGVLVFTTLKAGVGGLSLFGLGAVAGGGWELRLCGTAMVANGGRFVGMCSCCIFQVAGQGSSCHQHQQNHRPFAKSKKHDQKTVLSSFRVSPNNSYFWGMHCGKTHCGRPRWYKLWTCPTMSRIRRNSRNSPRRRRTPCATPSPATSFRCTPTPLA